MWGGGHPLPTPYPLSAFGASILAHTALDLGLRGDCLKFGQIWSCPPKRTMTGTPVGKKCSIDVPSPRSDRGCAAADRRTVFGPPTRVGAVFFSVSFRSFTETELFAFSLLCCSISTSVVMSTIRCVALFSVSCCAILHTMSCSEN